MPCRRQSVRTSSSIAPSSPVVGIDDLDRLERVEHGLLRDLDRAGPAAAAVQASIMCPAAAVVQSPIRSLPYIGQSATGAARSSSGRRRGQHLPVDVARERERPDIDAGGQLAELDPSGRGWSPSCASFVGDGAADDRATLREFCCLLSTTHCTDLELCSV